MMKIRRYHFRLNNHLLVLLKDFARIDFNNLLLVLVHLIFFCKNLIKQLLEIYIVRP
jgi:hypothetical protein